MKKDIFEILGINGREDSYTDLMKYCFDTWENFRIEFLKIFTKKPNKDFKLKIRKQYTDKDNLAIIPDMTLYSDDEIIIIENKIFSGEGYEQTKKYIQYEQDIIDILKKENNKIKAKKCEYYYLTLEGKDANSKKFHTIKWSEIITKCCVNISSISDDESLKIIIKDLVARCNEYDRIEEPQNNECLEEYIKRNDNSGFITKEILFKKYMNKLFENIINKYSGFENVVYSTSNNWSGKKFIGYIYKEEWKSKLERDECTDENDDFKFIHIEFSYVEKEENLKLGIHYEVNPYYPQKKMNQWIKESELNNKIYTNYKNNRNNFKNNLYKCLNDKYEYVKSERTYKDKNNINAWKKNSRCLSVLDTSISKYTVFEKLEKWIEETVEEAIQIIEEVINK